MHALAPARCGSNEQKGKQENEEAKVDRLGPARDRDRPQIGKDSMHDREGAVTPRHDDHARDQGPRGGVRQGRGLPRHEQVRVQDGVPEARHLRALPLRREEAVQVLPPVQLALPRVRGAEVREAREAPVRLQRMRRGAQMRPEEALLPPREGAGVLRDHPLRVPHRREHHRGRAAHVRRPAARPHREVAVHPRGHGQQPRPVHVLAQDRLPLRQRRAALDEAAQPAEGLHGQATQGQGGASTGWTGRAASDGRGTTT